MGVTRNRLGVPGEKEFLGKEVSYCVDCDANFYKGSQACKETKVTKEQCSILTGVGR
jgi:alkyl hydroperoxide reductase subunit AhpF